MYIYQINVKTLWTDQCYTCYRLWEFFVKITEEKEKTLIITTHYIEEARHSHTVCHVCTYKQIQYIHFVDDFFDSELTNNLQSSEPEVLMSLGVSQLAHISCSEG